MRRISLGTWERSRAGRVVSIAMILLGTAAVVGRCVGVLPLAAEEPPRVVDLYRADGTREAYGVRDPRTGVVDLYDAKTSKRLGTVDPRGGAFDAAGGRAGSALDLVPLDKKGKGGKK